MRLDITKTITTMITISGFGKLKIFQKSKKLSQKIFSFLNPAAILVVVVVVVVLVVVLVVMWATRVSNGFFHQKIKRMREIWTSALFS